MLDVLKLVYILNPSQRVSHRLNQVPTNLGNNMYDIHCAYISQIQYEHKMYTRCRWGICNSLIDLGFFWPCFKSSDNFPFSMA